ncbi:hypothetical protein C8R43DRAFT_1026829 [Mycena crocata]|nr:hypothetical protein C8R43DRAFT_1026829 [Mycena crocata]
MAPKYLCCLPLRLGVLLISFFSFLSNAVVSGLLAFVLILDREDKLKNKDGVQVELRSRFRIAMIVLASVCGLVALISFTGFIGAIRKKESYVGVFTNLLRFFLVVQIAVVVAYFILYFVDKNKFASACINGSTDQSVIDACNGTSKLSIPVLIVSAVLPLLFQAYGVYIVAAYARKLRQEGAYARVGEESYPLTHEAAHPYVDKHGHQIV